MKRLFFAALLAGLAASRFCHTGVLWTEEDLPMAAAIQMLERVEKETEAGLEAARSNDQGFSRISDSVALVVGRIEEINDAASVFPSRSTR